MSAAIAHIGNEVIFGCDQLLTAVQYNTDDDDRESNHAEVNQWLMQRHANFPFHQPCSSISVTPQMIQQCVDTHGIERATEVDDQQMTALHIHSMLSTSVTTTPLSRDNGVDVTEVLNTFVSRDCIRAYLQLAPGAAEQEDSYGMTPFQYLCRNDVAFFLEEDRNFSSLMAWWYCCMP